MAQQLSTTYCTFKLFFAKLMTVKLFNAKSWYWFFLPLLCFLAPTRTAFGFFHRIQFSHDRFDLFFQLILESEAREDYWGKVCACVRMRARVRVGASKCLKRERARKCARERARDKEREWERAFLRVESWNFWRMAIIPAWLSSFFLRLLSAAAAAKKSGRSDSLEKNSKVMFGSSYTCSSFHRLEKNLPQFFPLFGAFFETPLHEKNANKVFFLFRLLLANL